MLPFLEEENKNVEEAEAAFVDRCLPTAQDKTLFMYVKLGR
jgi:hypothetical protein